MLASFSLSFFACKRISLNSGSERVILCLPMGKPPRSTQLVQIPEEPVGGVEEGGKRMGLQGR